jgi:hypothetical protein
VQIPADEADRTVTVFLDHDQNGDRAGDSATSGRRCSANQRTPRQALRRAAMQKWSSGRTSTPARLRGSGKCGADVYRLR